MSSEHQFSRPDARHTHPGAPDWVPKARTWARVTGVLAGIVALFLIFFAPGLIYGDLGILIGLGWLSSPAALVFAPLIGWLVSWLLGRVIRREATHPHPSPDRVSLLLIAAIFLVLVAGAATWIAVASTPTEKFLP
jgi:hypothetical protein